MGLNQILKIHNLNLYSDHKRNKTSHSLIQKCDFFDVSEINVLKRLNNSKHFLISSVCISKNGAMIWNYSDISELKMKKLSERDLEKYLEKIETKTLLAYGVYQIEAQGQELFEHIKGDRNSIMGLPIKEIINYIKVYKDD